MIGFLLSIANALIYLRHPILTGKYLRRFRRLPNVAYPRIQPERMLWRKVFDRNPLYCLMLDKLAVREFARARCPGLQTLETVWVGSEPKDIPDALLAPGYVIKTNNGADRNIFTDATTTRTEVEAKVRKWLRTPYATNRGEWGYRRIQPAVLVQKRVVAPEGGQVVEMNVQVAMGHCFNLSALQNVKTPITRRSMFDRNGIRFPFPTTNVTRGRVIPELPPDFKLPAAHKDAVRYAEAIGADCDFVRADFICAGERLYFSECTVFMNSGYDIFPEGVERLCAANWDLRNSWFMRQRWRGPYGWYAALYRAARDRRSPDAAAQDQARSDFA
jgi:hypothetical protein